MARRGVTVTVEGLTGSATSRRVPVAGGKAEPVTSGRQVVDNLSLGTDGNGAVTVGTDRGARRGVRARERLAAQADVPERLDVGDRRLEGRET